MSDPTRSSPEPDQPPHTAQTQSFPLGLERDRATEDPTRVSIIQGPDRLDAVLTAPFDRVSALCRSFTAEWEQGRPDLPAYLSRVPAEERPTLLRNLLEHDVRARRQAGEPPTTRDYLDRLPSEYADVVRRAFLDASSLSLNSAFEPTPSDQPPAVAPAASRLGDYRLIREVGRGGMGAVFEAIHLGRGHRVALKTLPAVSGDALHRFKREFRALADVTHPNLVGLRTLESDGVQWFLTLDLLDGCDFLSHVRPGGRVDVGRLRRALAQLAAGVMALHARGVVHRDLKPGNVMVEPDGRVVILDFGLVAELGRAAALSAHRGVVGTPAYMAPEQAAGDAVGPPADWYAVGVMLYEALVGTRPFDGKDVWAILRAKQDRDAPGVPADLDIPPDLAELCAQLLARTPAARPDPLQIAGAVAAAVPAAGPPGTADQLVARDAQLAALAEALSDLRRTAAPVTAFITGRSGEGKTSLAEHFLAPLRADPSLVVMSGRCYDRESVPFKALDTLIDSLSSHLRSLPEGEAASLLPDDTALLARVFPVLNRCEAVARIATADQAGILEQQVRARAFGALRLLLTRIGATTPVVWFADDLQWGDEDSARALFEVLRPPTAPAVLVLGSYRSDEAETSPFLKEWAELQRVNAVVFGDRNVAVGPLSLPEATQLVVNVVGRDDEVIRRRAVQFHAQTGGNPFLLTELAGCFDPDADAFFATDIHGVLERKLGVLPAGAGPLLDAVSVSGQALELDEAIRTAELDDTAEAVLTRMRNMRLLRLIGGKVDTYHDRIRYSVLDRMAPPVRRGLHARLAGVIERTDGGLTEGEIDTLVSSGERGDGSALARVYDLGYHWDAAGDRRRALAYGMAAAVQARGQFALDVAAQQYTLAQRNVEDAPVAVQFRVARGLGETLMQLGRYDHSKRELEHAFSIATEACDVAEVLGLRGELASKLGLIAESIGHYEDALGRLGVTVPRTTAGMCWGLVRELAVHVVHAWAPWRLHKNPPDRAEILRNRLLGRIEWSLYCNNALRLLWASFAGLNRAERLPRSAALSIQYLVQANDMAVVGWHSRAERYYRAAGQLFADVNDQWGVAVARSHFSFGAMAAGRFEQALALSESGREDFTKLGDVFELHLGWLSRAQSYFAAGDLPAAIREGWDLFNSCVRYGDDYIGPEAVYVLCRSSLGQFPYDELSNCVRVLPGNNMGESMTLMAEGFWHTRHGRTAEAVSVFERAWNICSRNYCVMTFNMSVASELASALRRHAEVIKDRQPHEAVSLQRRWLKMAKVANRLSWFLPPERPHALRELSLVYAQRGRTRKAWKLAVKSCQIAEQQKARYQYALSHLVEGQLAAKLGHPEANNQVRQAQAEIDRIEESVRNALQLGRSGAPDHKLG